MRVSQCDDDDDDDQDHSGKQNEVTPVIEVTHAVSCDSVWSYKALRLHVDAHTPAVTSGVW